MNMNAAKCALAMNPAARAQAESIMQTTISISTVGGPCIRMVYPIAVLIVMGLPSVRKAFEEIPASEMDGGYSAGSTDIRPREY